MYEIGKKIATFRKERKMSQTDLANELGITKQTIIKYEAEKNSIPIDTLSHIANIFKIPIERFFSDNNEYINEIQEETNFKKIPIISKVSAGLGTFGIDDILDWLKLPTSISKKADFATLIDGDSMEPKIEDGSLVLVHQNLILDNGDIGIFYLNEEVFCKKFSKDPFTNIVTLKSLNKDYSPIIINEDDDFRIIGKVVGVFDYNI